MEDYGYGYGYEKLSLEELLAERRSVRSRVCITDAQDNAKERREIELDSLIKGKQTN